ncbi:bifunctional phosphopantothenoylcysteine decarboxylase/phosphopantothenate--cysteine ligase CoaBC [Methanosphaera cuniculi]|uniref:bifunctional phosphopantothenoylcysteine decarboxylase/phosphopantothenate--cysteine ligase CoaBC n=1 Tax=Methanosphaera cuniculi TaxID=1077256 RepID=UPI0026EEDC5D|nr:bifunctional phosphopantothenoylcysteine decarboxylase/phosphopantothenate--cysteine ligase CoaBC [Methanosphaera cuniculi]
MKIILCITGSIAAVEDLKLVHALQRKGFDVQCFMTPSACELITPLSMEFATKHPVVTKITGYVEHVTNAKADLILVAPSTANTISKFANKIADTPVTTMLLTASGYKTPILFVPSMHISMYKAVEDKIEQIKTEQPHAQFLEPVNKENKAKFPAIDDVVLESEKMVSENKLKDMNVIVSAGATFEPIDAMRGITNRSSGKMGLELAKEAYRQGANVTMVCGQMSVDVPQQIKKIDVETTSEMMNVIKNMIEESDIYISAAAISDFEVDQYNEGKISSNEDVTIKFRKLPKILEEIKQIKPSIYVVGFKAEAGLSEDELIKRAKERMDKYQTDIMIANDLLVEGGGAGSDDNEVYIISQDETTKLTLDSKENISKKIIEKIYKTM